MGFLLDTQAAQNLGQHLTALYKAVEHAERAIAGHVALPDIHLEIKGTAQGCIPSLGVGGFCPSAELIQIAIDPNHEVQDFAPTGAFARTLVHETHHALRWAGPGYGRTLGEALITEGLAGHFVAEVLRTPPEPWETAISDEEARRLWPKVAAQWDDDTYDHGAWFFGTDQLAGWAGYTLGFMLVGRGLGPDGSAARDVHTQAVQFKASLPY